MRISGFSNTLVILLVVVIGQASPSAAPELSAEGAAGGDNAPAAVALHVSDFSSVPVGSFPTHLTFGGGNMQVDDSQGDAMLRFEGGSWFHIPLERDLPESFTIEFDYYTTESYAVLFVAPFDAATSGRRPPSYSGYRQGQFNFFSIANTSVGAAIDAGSDSLPSAHGANSAFTQGVVPVRLEVNGGQARIIIDGKQVVMLPAATLHRTDVVEFFYGSMGSPGNGYIGSIRILSSSGLDVVGSGSDCICPKEGRWNAQNLEGKMDCKGAFVLSRKLKPERDNGAIFVMEDDCSSLFGDSMTKDEEDVLMTRVEGCRYEGTINGEEEGVRMVIDVVWTVENREFIKGEMSSSQAQLGVIECDLFRPFELTFDEALSEDQHHKWQKRIQEKIEQTQKTK